MKKLLVIAAGILAGVSVNAASFTWGAANIYGPDGNKLSGVTASIYCDALSTEALGTAVTSSSGAISASSATFDAAQAVAGTSYDFYFIVTTTYEGKEVSYKSALKSVTAQDVGAASIAFGNQATASRASGAWQSAAVPEPTSGLLMLLGIAGLALKRKRA